ncbi:Cystic fibrosis transmembrane conductance regulator [Quillaja saponaria]|uniref:Cystic fibrosis transmembrane conductance regulator n=1 Tax=Quillaja saponaria TaxID=32244 RepID=A0AAD7PGV8_QUISA|nr:Cystic fibrosis transmembrane conductance regulator [Quillaja saponaria]
MDVHHHLHHFHGVENDAEFWPVEHPVEPQDEDQPVKCPMPHYSSVINDGRTHEKRFVENLRKSIEVSTVVMDGKRMVTTNVEPTEPPVRAVRKRHHNLTSEGDYIITPMMRMPPPLPQQPNQNVTIFQMLRQFDEFESYKVK